MGHSTASGRSTGGRSALERNLADDGFQESPFNAAVTRQQQTRDENRLWNMSRAIERAKITSEGNGNWQMDIDGVGGGQILDETGGSRDPMYGRGGKVYSIRVWDADYNMIHETTIGGSLTEAKREMREALHRHYGTRG